GVSGIIRIDQAIPTLGQARKKMSDASLPGPRLLPVEPTDPYPLDALKESISSGKFDSKPYVLSDGGFNVALITPVWKYKQEEKAGLAAAQEKSKRTRGRTESMQNTFEPLGDLHEWAE